MSRYFRRSTGRNGHRQYKKMLDERGVNHIEQYRTPVYRPVSDAELEGFDIYEHLFKPGDAYWRLSKQVYGDPKFWWVIASFNRRPTLSHLEPGDIIRIPVDLSQALEILE